MGKNVRSFVFDNINFDGVLVLSLVKKNIAIKFNEYYLFFIFFYLTKIVVCDWFEINFIKQSLYQMVF